MKTIEKKVPFHTPIREEKEVKQVVSIRLKPSEVRYWKDMAAKFGIKDFSAFIRGAVHSAIHTSLRAEDPKWREFMEAVQPTAKRIFGHGFLDGGAGLYEESGTASKGVAAKELLSKMRKKHRIG